ncbi:hypothetical protein AMS68_007538 [Peltaster fructicola]|uniref:Apple domain-containing protein n=1 Tax=Peltaster fructicola TaxID=286661 RepID=A0A6H0Y524_9PEZI|nr:hypothetical protein AMS68_007538 [Peltaster fructicola]
MKTLSLVLATALALTGRANALCGQSGYDSQDPYYISDDNAGQGSFNACGQVCYQDTNCKAFAYNSVNCMLFSHPLTGDNFSQDSSSSDIYNDRSCFTPPTTSSSAPAFTSTIASATGIPAGCPSIPSAQPLLSLTWVNTTHNCDCAASHPDVGNGQGCLNSTGQWCEPGGADKTCTDCGIGVCMTGLPSQPVGYGPPDYVELSFYQGSTCKQSNPQSYKPRQVGRESINCGAGGQYPITTFIGDSNKDKSSGYVSLVNSVPCGNDNQGNSVYYAFVYNGTFPLSCTHDVYFNATCVLPNSTSLPLTNFYRL